ncbi:hypothetical protein [Citricoccus muralis]|uniref:DUF1648 domain-containing protein n=1 Tax=Citricoccus muralis TaxID=169134 RepID=A0ABY8H5K7_9MICC|nr:hypothetical protein [Citricoccus muralis]WFP16000.1 hypothetical protein P8192_11450 [Citricoccus muralis]
MTEQTGGAARESTTTRLLSRRSWSVLAASIVVLVGGMWPLMSYVVIVSRYSFDFEGLSVWRQHWVLMLLLGVVAPLMVMGVTLAHERMSSVRELRVGTLSLPQLARVLSWMICTWFAVLLITASGPMFGLSTAVLLVGLVGSVALVVVLTISGQRVQQLQAQFEERRRTAQPGQPTQPAPSEQPAQPAQPQAGAFWFAVPNERRTEGEHGFVLPAGEWILALEDRGDTFLVQAPNGRQGVLADLDGVERARS